MHRSGSSIFFTAHIRNPNTPAAYGIAVREYFTWLELGGLTELTGIRMHHVSAYIEILTRRYSAPTVKQHLAAIRRLFDWLIVGRVIDQNPAAPVRGPTPVVKKGKTPVLLARRGAAALDSIDVSTMIGLRDRAPPGPPSETLTKSGRFGGTSLNVSKPPQNWK